MLKNADIFKEDKKNCPYYNIIEVFKKTLEQNKFEKEKEETTINKIEKNNKDENDLNTNENKINNNKIKEAKYDENLYYYNPFPNLNNPILFIAIISFHHKKGSIVEYTYPSKEELLKNNENLSYLIENSGKTKENLIDELFFQLTCVCLPDGIHASNRDTQFFIIQDYKYPLYGISCYEQIKSFRDDTIENTRFSIQKSICIISLLPFYSSLHSKLSISVEAFFNQESLQDKEIINKLF